MSSVDQWSDAESWEEPWQYQPRQMSSLQPRGKGNAEESTEWAPSAKMQCRRGPPRGGAWALKMAAMPKPRGEDGLARAHRRLAPALKNRFEVLAEGSEEEESSAAGAPDRIETVSRRGGGDVAQQQLVEPSPASRVLEDKAMGESSSKAAIRLENLADTSAFPEIDLAAIPRKEGKMRRWTRQKAAEATRFMVCGQACGCGSGQHGDQGQHGQHHGHGGQDQGQQDDRRGESTWSSTRDVSTLQLKAGREISEVHPTGWQEVEVTVDSGSCDTVMPAISCQGIPIDESELSKRGEEYEVANGESIPNLGERRCLMMTKNSTVPKKIVFQVADVHKALLSVTRAADMGFDCHLSKKGGYMLDTSTQERIPIERKGNLYTMTVWVKSFPFARRE